MKVLLHILSVLGLLSWTVCFFFGLNYVTGCNMVVSIPVAIFAGIVLFVIFYFLRKMGARTKAEGDVKTAKTIEWIMGGLYLAAVLVTGFYINHMANVSLKYKEDIQTKAIDEIKELGVTFSDSSETPNSYRQYVQDKISGYEVNLRSQNYTGDFETALANFEEDMLDNSGYNSLAVEVNDALGVCNASVKSWNLMTVVRELNQLQTNKPKWESQVVECSNYTHYTRNEPFQCVSEHNYGNLADILQHPSFSFSIIAIVLMLGIQLLILLGYILGHRKGDKFDTINTNDYDGGIVSY